jgi:hypothetical protein
MFWEFLQTVWHYSAPVKNQFEATRQLAGQSTQYGKREKRQSNACSPMVETFKEIQAGVLEGRAESTARGYQERSCCHLKLNDLPPLLRRLLHRAFDHFALAGDAGWQACRGAVCAA